MERETGHSWGRILDFGTDGISDCSFELVPFGDEMSVLCCQAENALKYHIISSYFHLPTHTESTLTNIHV